MKLVRKKILPKYFNDVEKGIKKFELRKDDDDIQVGDILALNEFDGYRYTGRSFVCRVIYVLRGVREFGLEEGFCIIGLGDHIVNFFGEYYNEY